MFFSSGLPFFMHSNEQFNVSAHQRTLIAQWPSLDHSSIMGFDMSASGSSWFFRGRLTRVETEGRKSAIGTVFFHFSTSRKLPKIGQSILP